MYIVLFFVLLNSVQNARYSSSLTNVRSNNNNTMPRFSVGAYMKKKKQAKEEKISNREDIESLEIEIKEQEDTLAKKRKLSRSLDEKLRRLDVKVRYLIHFVWVFGINRNCGGSNLFAPVPSGHFHCNVTYFIYYPFIVINPIDKSHVIFGGLDK